MKVEFKIGQKVWYIINNNFKQRYCVFNGKFKILDWHVKTYSNGSQFEIYEITDNDGAHFLDIDGCFLLKTKKEAKNKCEELDKIRISKV